jgi:hypothetical protein
MINIGQVFLAIALKSVPQTSMMYSCPSNQDTCPLNTHWHNDHCQNGMIFHFIIAILLLILLIVLILFARLMVAKFVYIE